MLGKHHAALLLFALLLLSACAGSRQQALNIRDISGMTKIDANTYLIANDQKAHKVSRTHLGVLRFREQTAAGEAPLQYQPVELRNWPAGLSVPSDIEALTALPGDGESILAAESGYYKGDFGRIFHLRLTRNDAQWQAEYLGHFTPFAAESEGFTTPSAQQIEGVAAFAFGASRIGLILARRGSPKAPAELVWGELKRDGNALQFAELGRADIPLGYRRFGTRGAGDVFLHWDVEGKTAEIWCVATRDEGDDGPFASVIYRVGSLRRAQSSFSLRLDRAELLWRLDGLKVEALAAPPEAVTGSVLSIGTDDERYPAVWRALMPPAVSSNEHLVMANLWVQTAAEVQALYHQAYNTARRRLYEALRKKYDRPPAVIVDIDETVLDNSPYATMQIITNQSYPAGWKQWTDRASARALPGAVAFLQEAVAAGVDVFYVSNRRVAELDATLENLRRRGFPQAERSHLLLRQDTSSKKERRAKISETHEIILLAGDNLADFSHIFEKKSVADRARLVEELKEEFGSRFIVLPNPVYGDWEGAVYEYNYRASDAEKDAMRKKALRRE